MEEDVVQISAHKTKECSKMVHAVSTSVNLEKEEFQMDQEDVKHVHNTNM